METTQLASAVPSVGTQPTGDSNTCFQFVIVTAFSNAISNGERAIPFLILFSPFDYIQEKISIWTSAL
jgi:hypothetical protein